jgi:alpha-mannosidase
VNRRPGPPAPPDESHGAGPSPRHLDGVVGACPPIPTTRALHLVGNAHIDPVWLWRWPEGLAEVRATFRSALDRIREHDTFIFTASSAAFYAWVEAEDPPLFAEVVEAVRAGRWAVVGGWWVEADCNLPGAESFVRQALVAQRWFAQHLGVSARTGFCPDAFGHHAMLPAILSGSRLDGYLFMRPQPHELDLPARTFWWEAADGSRVLASRIPFEYAVWGGALDEHVRRCADELRDDSPAGLCFFGVGNHGGGPTRENLASLDRLRRDASLPALVDSSPDRFLDAVRASGAQLPVVHGELQHHARGCYSAHLDVRRSDRRVERLLLEAETLAALAGWLTGRPDGSDLERGWRAHLFDEFHDILAGTAIGPAYEDARDMAGEAAALALPEVHGALTAIARSVAIEPAPGRSRSLLVVNPHAWPARARVELETGGVDESWELVDEAGRPVPHQLVRSDATVNGGRRRLAFSAELPSLGWRVLRARPLDPEAPRRPVPASNLPPRPVDRADLTLVDDRLRVVVDGATGAIASLVDLAAGLEVVHGGGSRPVVLEDSSDTWSHDLERYDGRPAAMELVTADRVEEGPVRSAVRVEHATAEGDLRVTQTFELWHGLGDLEVRIEIESRARQRLLKLRTPVLAYDPVATFGVPFGHVVRLADGAEQPASGWIDVTGRSPGGRTVGLTFVLDIAMGADVVGSDVGLTVLRSPIAAHHDPRVPEDGVSFDVLNQGVHRLRYRLMPHLGPVQPSEAWRSAAELAAELAGPVATFEAAHPGPLPPRGSLLEVAPPSVVVTAVKRAEDDRGSPDGDIVLRAHEADGQAAEATFRLAPFGRSFAASFRPHQIRTFRVPRDPARPVVAVDLIEWPVETSADSAEVR